MLRSETADEPARTAAALRGLRRYQSAPRTPPPLVPPTIARAGRARLLDYGGSGPLVLFVPSLINPPTVLDLDVERSLLRWLAGQELHPLLLDWGTPTADEADLSIAGHIETMLLPLIAALEEPPLLVGYCLGGTMALAAATLVPVRGVATIAAPWHFARYPAATRAGLTELWERAVPIADATGVVPMEVLQAAFWRLDPTRTIAKYEALDVRGDDAAALDRFVRLEDWANDGPPLTRAAAHELFERMYLADDPGRGAWRVGGAAIDPAGLSMPMLEIVSTTDRIVPAATAAGVGKRRKLALGHVGMIVGGRAKTALWRPLARWLSETGRS